MKRYAHILKYEIALSSLIFKFISIHLPKLALVMVYFDDFIAD